MAIKQLQHFQHFISTIGHFSLKVLILLITSLWLFGGSSPDGCASSDPAIPKLLSFYSTTEFATYSVAPSLPLAYVVGTNSLEVLDLGDPSSPLRLDYINLVGNPIGGSDFKDQFLYMGFRDCCETENWKLEIYDTAQTISPSLLRIDAEINSHFLRQLCQPRG